MSIIKKFEDRKNYKEFEGEPLGIEFMEEFYVPLPIDLWYTKTLYGRVDQIGDARYAPDSLHYTRRKQLVGTNLFALNFVADAFNDFKARVDRISSLSGPNAYAGIESNSLIRNFSAQKAYISFESLYSTYIEGVFDIFMKEYLRKTSRDQEIEGYSDFLRNFVKFTNTYARSMPITKTAVIKYGYNTILTNGLVIEIAYDDHDDDDVKAKYIDDPNFTYFHQLAKKYGFNVDHNAPWRLVANISSPQMQRYWLRGNLDPTLGAQQRFDPMMTANLDSKCWEQFEQTLPQQVHPEKLELTGKKGKDVYSMFPFNVGHFFDSFYKKAYAQDIHNLASLTVQFYNQYVSDFPKVLITNVSPCPNKEKPAKLSNLFLPTSSRVVVRKPVNISNITQSNRQWFQIYHNLRLKEEGMTFSTAHSDNVIKQSLKILKHVDKKKNILHVDRQELSNIQALKYLNESIKGFPKKDQPADSFAVENFFNLTNEDTSDSMEPMSQQIGAGGVDYAGN